MLDLLFWWIGCITVVGTLIVVSVLVVLSFLEYFQVFGKATNEDAINEYLHELWLEELNKKSTQEKFLPKNRISKYYSQPSDN